MTRSVSGGGGQWGGAHSCGGPDGRTRGVPLQPTDGAVSACEEEEEVVVGREDMPRKSEGGWVGSGRWGEHSAESANMMSVEFTLFTHAASFSVVQRRYVRRGDTHRLAFVSRSRDSRVIDSPVGLAPGPQRQRQPLFPVNGTFKVSLGKSIMCST